MKKFLVILALLLITLSLASCTKDKPVEPTPDPVAPTVNADPLEALKNFDIVETKDIVLGNKVDSVVITASNGEKVTVDNTTGFYQIFAKIGFEFREPGSKYSCSAEMKLGDQTKSFINMNAYYLENAEFYEFRTKRDGDDTVASMEEYSYVKYLENHQNERIDFTRYLYKDEKAFGGGEINANDHVIYRSEEYPIIPQTGTELNEMQARSISLRTLILFTQFFRNYAPYETNDGTIDFNALVTREYEIYENYIVLRQTAPFLDLPTLSSPQNAQIFYARITSAEYSVTQEAYYNIETGKIEMIKVYGSTMSHVAGGYYGNDLEINMHIYIHDTAETEATQKVNDLIAYVKENADN